MNGQEREYFIIDENDLQLMLFSNFVQINPQFEITEKKNIEKDINVLN